ncbi:MAG: nitrogen regulation protein NR(II) [Gammaproteobacteria bacterium]
MTDTFAQRLTPSRPPTAAGRSRHTRGAVVPLNLWTPLRFFNLYRLVIAGLFALLGAIQQLPPMFTQVDRVLLTWAASLYLVAAIVLQLVIDRRLLPFYVVRNLLMLVDVAALMVFMHASGGAAGGFGILLVVAVAGACLVAAWRAAIAFAALATLAVLAETILGSLYLGYSAANYTQAGLLGAGLFATAVLASMLSEQARYSEALAAEREVALAQLSRLNEHIVQRMRSGIIVLDADRDVVLANEAARALLRPAGGTTAFPALDEPLLRAHQEWRQRGENRKTPLKLANNAEVIVSFTPVGEGAGGDTLVFLEDAAETQQRAQQIKLASLGRLTASIAHEIRNPLGAISHAGQLLSESPELQRGDLRLAQIIVEHAARVNEIIKNVMMIGRRELAVAESFALRGWLETFIHELRERHALAPAALVCQWLRTDLTVRMDRSQLQQILWNLCENGLRYSRHDPQLTFVCGVQAESARPFIDIIDTGPGMTDDVAEQVFEPFFTGEAAGTGLGLYIARELCEANQATLSLQEHGARGCRFRILFAHPDRQQLGA